MTCHFNILRLLRKCLYFDNDDMLNVVEFYSSGLPNWWGIDSANPPYVVGVLASVLPEILEPSGG
jgi:hypothetical protein